MLALDSATVSFDVQKLFLCRCYYNGGMGRFTGEQLRLFFMWRLQECTEGEVLELAFGGPIVR